MPGTPHATMCFEIQNYVAPFPVVNETYVTLLKLGKLILCFVLISNDMELVPKVSFLFMLNTELTQISSATLQIHCS